MEGVNNKSEGEDEIGVRNRLSSSSSNPIIRIKRPVLTQNQFDDLYSSKKDDEAEETKKQKATCCNHIANKASSTVKSWLPPSFKVFLLQLFPFISIMANYNWRFDFVRDLISGASVTCLHVPQAMAYGQLATLRPIHGLYVAFFPGVVYFFLGTSRQLSVGVFAVVSLMVAKLLDAEIATGTYGLPSPPSDQSTLSSNSTSNSSFISDSSNYTTNSSDNSFFNYEEEELRVRIEIATSYNLIVGALQILLGIVGAGFITDYLNEPFTSGYTTACACHVITAQVWLAFGLKGVRHTGAFKILLTYRDLIKMLPKAHWLTFGIFITTFAILFSWKEFIEPRLKKKMSLPIPVDLILVIIVDAISYFADLNPVHKVPIVGPIPSDFPIIPKAPKHFRINYLYDSIPLVLVSFSICFSMSKIMAKKYRYDLRPSQEFLALGTANLASSFFTCYTSSTAMSRTLIQGNVGGRTQVASLIACSLILLIILFLGVFLQPLPTCILGVVVIANVYPMLKQVKNVPRLWRLCKLDAFTWLVAFLVTFLIDVDAGLFAGVAFVFITIIIQTSRPRFSIQHQVEATELFSGEQNTKNVISTHPAVVLKWSGPIYFANIDQLHEAIKNGIHPSPEKKKNEELAEKAVLPSERVTAVILDISAVGFIDSTGVEFFKRTINELAELKVDLLLAACPSGILLTLLKEEEIRTFLATNTFVTTLDALTAVKSERSKFWQKPAKKNLLKSNSEDKKVTKEQAAPGTAAAVALLSDESKV